MDQSAAHRNKALGNSILADELIGIAASHLDAMVPPERDEHQPPNSVEIIESTSITFNTQLIEVAERIYSARRKRDFAFDHFFGVGLFGEPAWDLLLDLYISNGRNRPISVSSACLASGAPTTTALRYITELVRRQLIVRSPHPADRRVFILHLSQLAVRAMEETLND